MRSPLRHLLLASLLLMPLAGGAEEASTGFLVIHSAELSSMLEASGSKAVVLDANTPEFRASHGILPGARLLSSFNKYDVAKELPTSRDTPLIFYCANSH